MPYIISPNMSLQIPSVGTQPGPDYALNINTSLSLVDAHDHSPGNGVQITPDGLDINADLSFNENNAISLRTARFEAQNAVLTDPADIGCLYVVADDLYYNDGNGNDIRITQSGQVVSGSGNIAGLAPPASAVYTSGNGTFTWQQDVNTPANMDSGPVTVREPVVNGFGITLTPNASIAANYTMTLPAAAPASVKVLSMNASGNVSTSAVIDGAQFDGNVEIDTANLEVTDGNVEITNGNINMAGNINITGTSGGSADIVSIGGAVFATGVKPGGGSNANIVSTSQESVAVTSPFSSYPVVVGTSYSVPYILAGTVQNNLGSVSILSGTGFTATSSGGGQNVTITMTNPPFSGAGYTVITGGNVEVFASRTSNSFELFFGVGNLVRGFMVIGSRPN